MRWYDNSNVTDAVVDARAAKRPLLVDFWSPTCSGCAKLAATTYADPVVQDHLGTHFVAVKYNTKRPNEWFRKLNGSFGHFWHPNIVVLDHHLIEARRVIGYLPTTDLLTELELGRALVELYQRRPHEALGILDAALVRWPAAAVAPELLYWAGVAAYQTGGGLSALTPRWRDIERRYPGSPWARRADCLDVTFGPDGFDPEDLSTILSSALGASTSA